MLDRKKSAEILTQLADTIDGPCVLTIDAPWGAGKTTFLKMWSQYLRNEGYPVVEFNAWETDHAGDPFIALTSEITEGLRAFEKGAFIPKTTEMAEAAMQVAHRAIPGIIRILTAGILDFEPLIEKEAGKLLASYAENRLKKYKDQQESIKTFRNKLQALADALINLVIILSLL